MHVIVFGNEKGGTGKSTIAMHVAIYLLKAGYKIGTIDIDARQGTFTRYFENRKKTDLQLPEHFSIFKSTLENQLEANSKEYEQFLAALSQLKSSDFVIIDTPGNDTYLSRCAHSYADTLITPLNDSFIDLDVLVKIGDNKAKDLKPSIYSEMVWQQKMERAKRHCKPTDWIVLRNRLSTLFNNNKKDVGDILEKLSKRIGFRFTEGFCERVIFKELFLKGMTLLDIENKKLQLSHIAARQELRELVKFMRIDGGEKRS